MGESDISKFLAAKTFAVVGASQETYKFGHRCYKCYLDHGYKAYPVNPNCQTILGNAVYARLSDLPETVESVSIITPPAVTEKVVEEAIACGIRNIWMQPGAESRRAVDRASAAGLNVIWGGPCLLVELANLDAHGSHCAI